MYRRTGASSATFRSATRRITAVAVNVLVTEAIRNSVSGRTGSGFSTPATDRNHNDVPTDRTPSYLPPVRGDNRPSRPGHPASSCGSSGPASRRHRNAANLNTSVGVSRVTGILSAAECNKAPFMYEMKGALSGHGPGSAGFPASRLRVSQSPGLTVPDRLISQPHRPRSTGRPASLFRFIRLPGLPGATHSPPVPGTRCKFQFPGLYIAPGETPWMVPVSCGENISTPFAPRRARAHRNSFLSFFLSTPCPQNPAGYPHVTAVIHRLMHSYSTGHPT